MTTPLTCLALCDAATKEAANRNDVRIDQRVVGVTMTPAQSKLADRLSPEVVRKVYELAKELAKYSEVFAGDIGSRGPSQRNAVVGHIRVRHVIYAEEIVTLLDGLTTTNG